jgi:hypothetical protein
MHKVDVLSGYSILSYFIILAMCFLVCQYSNDMPLIPLLQKMVTIVLEAIIVNQHIPGSVPSLCVEAVILLHQELEMVVFDYGLLKVRQKAFGLCSTFHW